MLFRSLILFLALLIIIGTEMLYREPLYKASFKNIENLNKRMPNFAIMTFILISDLGGGKTIAFYTIMLSIFL